MPWAFRSGYRLHQEVVDILLTVFGLADAFADVCAKHKYSTLVLTILGFPRPTPKPFNALPPPKRQNPPKNHPKVRRLGQQRRSRTVDGYPKPFPESSLEGGEARDSRPLPRAQRHLCRSQTPSSDGGIRLRRPCHPWDQGRGGRDPGRRELEPGYRERALRYRDLDLRERHLPHPSLRAEWFKISDQDRETGREE